MKCIQKSILSKSKSVNNFNKKRNDNQRLKRRNAFKVSKGVEKRLLGTMCIKGSITTTISSHDNSGEAGSSGIKANQTTIPKFIDESKL
jgi:hypothetical protein